MSENVSARFYDSDLTKKKFSCLFTCYFRVLMMLFVYTFLFQDLLRVLSDLLDRKLEDGYRYFLGNHESLLCIHTVLSILSGQVILIPICLYFIYVQKKIVKSLFTKKVQCHEKWFHEKFPINQLFVYFHIFYLGWTINIGSSSFLQSPRSCHW